ncbi:MAG: polysaccharide deacetylase family protein [Vicingus serpentipes]|nr:polysaccharide deacetylase family protein [Vicingus serpentipes]
MYLKKSPQLVKRYYQNLLWDIPNEENNIYLTFDDGPTPEITEWVLGVLKQYQVKATFFCLGCNVKKYHEIYQTIQDDEHAIGNHTFNHLNGWKTGNETYLNNVADCAEIIASSLFRPPYGRIRKSQAKELVNSYKIVMWDVLSGDFDAKTTPEKCLQNVTKFTKSGSIIVFHDSVKAFKNLEYALPRAIEYLLERGFNFKTISGD